MYVDNEARARSATRGRSESSIISYFPFFLVVVKIDKGCNTYFAYYRFSRRMPGEHERREKDRGHFFRVVGKS